MSLQHVKIPVYIGPMHTRQGQAGSVQKALAKPATRLIEHTLRTLKTVHIVVHGLPHPAKLGSTSSTLRLQQLERVLERDRAPNLTGGRLTIVGNCELQSRFRYWPLMHTVHGCASTRRIRQSKCAPTSAIKSLLRTTTIPC